jgi:hypothetical protein
MKHNKKKIILAGVGIVFAFVLFAGSVSKAQFRPPGTPAFTTFGGIITKKNWRFCLVPVPFFPFIIPYPFIYIEVGPPVPAKLYYLYGIPGTPLDSKMYREWVMEKDAWALGSLWFQMDDVFRESLRCLNKSSLPNADGVIKDIGTSCLTKRPEGDSYDPLVNSPLGEGVECQPDEKNLGITPSRIASLIPPIFNVNVPPSDDPADPSPNEYSTYCDPVLSTPGNCVPLMPIPDIKANDSDGPVTINYGGSATISWISQNAANCTISPAGWSGTFNLGWDSGPLTQATTYTLTCTGQNEMTASDSVTVNVGPQVPAPTAALGLSTDGINYSGSVIVNASSTVYYSWSSSNANGFSSSISGISYYDANAGIPNGTDACGISAGTGWAANSASGSGSSGLMDCQKGYVYTLTYAASETNTGQTAQSSVTLTVSP